MDERTLEHLDFVRILSLFEGFSRTPGGRNAFRHLSPHLSREEIEKTYGDCLLLTEIITMVDPCPLEGVPELEEVLERLQVSGVVLDSTELLDVALFIGKLREIGSYFKKVEEKTHITYPPVLGRWEEIPSLYPLKSRIEKAIDNAGHIKDSASSRLRDLRKKADRQKQEIQAILDRMIHSKRVASQLADQYLTVRNGRYVLPVKAGAKHTFQGIIHDQSQSRLTFFIEPIECVELNNALSMTYQEIEREEEEIKRQLTVKVAEGLDSLRKGWEITADLDVIHARVLFMQAFKAVTVKLRETPGFSLRSVRHPLLVAQKAGQVVPIDLIMPKGKQILILSGVNAGGKTVALKTLGVSLLMVKAGLPVLTAPDGEMYPYDDIFTEIGDEQSIVDDLSTFTAHIRHLKGIIDRSSKDSLVLIDEIGVGTGMSEGAALALGILDILGRRGATVMVTTHFEMLKGYGAQNPLAMNVSVAFDAEKQQPLYALCYGIPGNSNAFEIAKCHGLDEEVLKAAQRYRSHQNRLLADLMSELENLKRKTEVERVEASDAKREILRLRDQFNLLYEEIKQKKEEILKGWRLKWDRQIKKQREAFRELMQKVKASSGQATSFHAYYSTLAGEFNRIAREQIEAGEVSNISGEPTSKGQVSVGDEVYVSTIEKEGQVAAINPHQKTADVMVKGLRLQIPLKKLRRLSSPGGKTEATPRSFVAVDVTTQARTELNLVGYRVQEALPEVDKFIDAALVHRMKEVTIIHGVGTGRLRNAIREFLSNHEGIKTFSDGEIRRGGNGITVVQLLQ